MFLFCVLMVFVSSFFCFRSFRSFDEKVCFVFEQRNEKKERKKKTLFFVCVLFLRRCFDVV